MLLLLAITAIFTAQAIPTIPDVFHAKIIITSLICDTSKTYPPCERQAEVSFDKNEGRSRVLWLKDFEDTNRTYIRRHDLGREYELRNVCTEGNICEKKCVRGELKHPIKDVPDLSKFVSDDQSMCSSTPNEIALTNGLIITVDPATNFVTFVKTKTMTWSIHYLPEPPSESHFYVPHSYRPKQLCNEQPNKSGFPYIRLFGGLLVV
eukprot:TRINITY_DN16981_c0_g1_i1.p1 TRINITY_DN16981_c0_g1~~TRINITY_DN16981_c0_g1_i1.p1  ORF type:complete len:217 (+),score=23.93 TRINITY_DN16981_c0_g1_i1:33-653(+)